MHSDVPPHSAYIVQGAQSGRRLSQQVSTKSTRTSQLPDEVPHRASSDASDLRRSVASVFQNALKEDGPSNLLSSRVPTYSSRNSVLAKQTGQSISVTHTQNGASQYNELDEEEAFFDNPSPSKGKRSQRKRVLSDDEDEREKYGRANTEEAQSAEDEEEEAAVEQEVSRRSISHRLSSGSTFSDLKDKSKSVNQDQRQSISVLRGM